MPADCIAWQHRNNTLEVKNTNVLIVASDASVDTTFVSRIDDEADAPENATMARPVRKAKGEMSRRLEYVRTEFASVPVSLAELHRLLGGKDFVSYQTVQNYHFDRDASVEYLARVAEFYSVDFEWLATGMGKASPWGTPGLEGEIDSTTRMVVHHLTDPEERDATEAYEARIAKTKFLGPLMESILSHVVNGFPDALDERRSIEEMQPMQLSEWKERDLRVIIALDRILDTTWRSALSLLNQELGLTSEDLSIDQQIRFGHAMILAILAMLPERDLPVRS